MLLSGLFVILSGGDQYPSFYQSLVDVWDLSAGNPCVSRVLESSIEFYLISVPCSLIFLCYVHCCYSGAKAFQGLIQGRGALTGLSFEGRALFAGIVKQRHLARPQIYVIFSIC